MELKETIVNECLKVLHREDVKEEFKDLCPLIDMLIKNMSLHFSFNYLCIY